MIIKFTVKKSYGDYFDKHTIDISQESNDYFNQPLKYFDMSKKTDGLSKDNK